MSTHLPVCHDRPRAIGLIELPDFYAVVEGTGRETDTVEVVCSVCHEISVCVLYQASLHTGERQLKVTRRV